MCHMTLGRPHVGVTTRRSIPRLSLCVAVLGLALSSSALAQPPAPAASDTDVSVQAMQLYNEGLKAAKLFQWDKARTFYLGAWRVQQHWQIAANLGRAEVKVGKHRDAAEHLAYFLREAPKIEPEDRTKTEELLEQAKAKVGTLKITARPDGAEIRIDGASIGTAPLKGDVFVEPGGHLFEARLAGYQTLQVTQDVGVGWRGRIDLRLDKVAPEKGGAVEPPPLPPIVPPPPVQEGGPNKTVVVVGGVVAGLAAAAGVGFTVGAQLKLNERETERPSCFATTPNCLRYNTAEKARLNFAYVAVTSYIAAGVFGVGTLTYALVKRSAEPKSTARMDLLLGPGVAGAMVTVPW
jgi:hypothetical protein